jgi:hypothetical protein
MAIPYNKCHDPESMALKQDYGEGLSTWYDQVMISGHKDPKYNGVYDMNRLWNGLPHYNNSNGTHFYYYSETKGTGRWNLDLKDQYSPGKPVLSSDNEFDGGYAVCDYSKNTCKDLAEYEPCADCTFKMQPMNQYDTKSNNQFAYISCDKDQVLYQRCDKDSKPVGTTKVLGDPEAKNFNCVNFEKDNSVKVTA